MGLRMKKSPASINQNATASAEQKARAESNAAGIIFHSKPTEKQATKEKTMKTTKPRAVRQYEAIEAHGKNLLAIFQNATERDPVTLCKKLRRLEAKASAIALRLCNGPEYAGGYEEVDALTDAILAKVNALLGNVHEYQPKTGARCTCRPGIERDNCAACEGTGRKIDFAAIRNRPALVPVFINRDPRGYALKIDDVWTHNKQARIYRDFGGYGILAPEITGN